MIYYKENGDKISDHYLRSSLNIFRNIHKKR